MTRAKIIAAIGLGMGDEGKGSIVDALTRRHQARLVVRFNGGCQAAHNVVCDDGRHHTFAQFGSGTLAGAATHLSRFMLIAPGAMVREARALKDTLRGQLPTVTVEQEALLITPFHSAANRLREWLRGEGRHGSCGWGIGETVGDSLADPDMVIRAWDAANPKRLANKLEYWRAKKFEEFAEVFNKETAETVQFTRAALDRSRVVECCDIFTNWAQQVRVVDRDYLAGQLEGRLALDQPGTVIFEGAQGVLLDETYGCAPHNTWSDCTFGNVERLLEGLPFERLGVIRSYMTRHGAGPFPTESSELQVPEMHNGQSRWQGAWRVGHADMPLLRHAVSACGGVDGLALTHADRIDPIVRVALHGERDVSVWHRAPTYEHFEREDVPGLFEDVALAPVRILSKGPTSADKEWL